MPELMVDLRWVDREHVTHLSPIRMEATPRKGESVGEIARACGRTVGAITSRMAQRPANYTGRDGVKSE